jgi:hypothetical protein
MSLLPRLCLILALTGLVSGCQVGAPAPSSGDVTPNAVTGDAIEVTALEAPPAAAPAVGSGGSPTPPAQVAPAPETEPPLPAADPAAEPAPALVPAAEAGATAEVGETEAVNEPAEVAPPPPPKSDRQIACERKDGSWEDTGGGLMICVRQTRDGGKRCTRESQCEGLCLARSGTCAPVDPLVGCQDILQDDGTRATQCIE